ncbi:uncharacterized protein LOC125207041 [Salvia hispanica]|uniref:uncharacterized protein LOC125207041 n=1 Tax=Salvia hispanica TaxID=49212 RepID=UPI0020098956|nr:uncharacterized protein LOC125207041 [Salvia hispanica]
MSDVTREALLMKIQTVHHLIEMCIQLYMNKEETIDYLSKKANIEPEIIKIVWERLEKENPKFFKAYHLSLVLKAQIERFNELLKKQVELMRMTGRLGPSSSNGSQMHSIHNNNGLGEAFVSDTVPQPPQPKPTESRAAPEKARREEPQQASIATSKPKRNVRPKKFGDFAAK